MEAPSSAASSLSTDSNPTATTTMEFSATGTQPTPKQQQQESYISPLQPRTHKDSFWSYLSWIPSSTRKAYNAEHKLLSRLGFYQSEHEEINTATITSTSHSTTTTTTVAVESHSSLEETNPPQDSSANQFSLNKSKKSKNDNDNYNKKNTKTKGLFAKIGLVDIGDGNYINTLVIDREDDHLKFSSSHDLLDSLNTNQLTQIEVSESERYNKEKRTLVMAHGYGAGLGFFYKTYHGLSQIPGWRIYSIDWLGMANSSRPKFPMMKKGQTEEEYITEAENFFIESLEKWREKNGVEKMTLLGHSLGGYLSAVYSLKYPEKVEELILASPAGIPLRPEDLQPGELRPGRKIPSWVTSMWDRNFTPMSMIRFLGPFGPNLVRTYTSRRFSYLEEQDAKDFHDYLFHICAQPGSGEYALGALLLPGAWARRPLHDRLAGLKMKTTFIYGSNDWMDVTGALSATKQMKVPTAVAIVQEAGHHLYMDNPDGFVEVVMNAMTSNELKPSEHVGYLEVRL